MFIANVHGKDKINSKAAAIGCTAGLCGTGWDAKPGLVGNTYGIKDALKAAGARWDSLNKAWFFKDWAALESAIDGLAA